MFCLGMVVHRKPFQYHLYQPLTMPYCLHLCPKALNFLSPYCGKMSSTYSHFIILYFLTYPLHSMRGTATSISKTILLSSSRNYVIIHLEYFGCSLARCHKSFKNPCIACSLLLCFSLFMALFFYVQWAY